jgi:hypothetical protein
MSPCGASRVLVPGLVVGVLVSTLLGNDAMAWVAAIVAMAATALVQRARGRSTSCAVPVRVEPAADTDEHPVR